MSESIEVQFDKLTKELENIAKTHGDLVTPALNAVRVLAQVVSSLEWSARCDVCLGMPINTNPCICGGSGLACDAVSNLREELVRSEMKITRLQNRLDVALETVEHNMSRNVY